MELLISLFKFVQQLIHKQLDLSKFMYSIYSNSSILQDPYHFNSSSGKVKYTKNFSREIEWYNDFCSFFSDIFFGDG